LQVAARCLGVSGTPEDQQTLVIPAQTPSQAECVKGAGLRAYLVMHQFSTFCCCCGGRKMKARQSFSKRQYILFSQADVAGKGIHQTGQISGS